MDLCLTFNCNGRVNYNDRQLSDDSLFLRGEIENVFYPQDEYNLSSVDIEIFDCNVPAATAILQLSHFVKCMDMQLKILNRHEKYSHTLNSTKDESIDFYRIRRVVCKFLLYVRTYLNSIKWDLHSLRSVNAEIEENFDTLFITVKRFLARLRNIPNSTFHYAPSKLGNKGEVDHEKGIKRTCKCVQPEFHMYHMHLELRWLFITLVYTRSIYHPSSMESRLDEFENIQGSIISDLVFISLKIFERIPLKELGQNTPFNCTCVRELWLILQIFIDSLSDRLKSKNFWDHVNDCVNTILKKNRSDGSQASSYHDLPVCKNPELFCLWIIHHLSLLYGYNADGLYLEFNCSRVRANYGQVEQILKSYVSKGGKDGERDEIDAELSIMIPLLNVLITNWWQPKASVISLLWDCFHKRFHEPFLLQTSGPWSLSVEKKTAADILKQVKDRINNVECTKESSYGLFLRLLGSFLKKNYSSNDTKQWNQIKGRVYSKFSKSKVQEFSVTGLYNFITLFITLALTADATNVCSVMLDLLPPITEFNSETCKKHHLAWKGKLAVLLLYNELGLNLSNIATMFVDTVNVISCRKDDTSRSMMTNFVEVLNSIFLSRENVDSGEYLFIGGWIDRYLLECSNQMIGTLIKMLIHIFEKCVSLNATSASSDSAKKMLDALWCYVACRLRQLIFNSVLTNDHYRDISKLAVAFTLEALRDPTTAKKHKHSAMSLFQHFASSMIVKDIKFTRRYLVLILEREQAIRNLKKEIRNFDTILIQAWIKCSILGYNINKSENKTLQNYILQFDEIREIFLTPNDISEFENSDEPILSFIMFSMKKQHTLKTEKERVQYDTRWRSYFNHIEKWILTPITEETKDSELAFWIYRCIGTLILCTSPILYSKNQANNMFRMLLNKAVLLSEHSFVKNLGKRIFSMILLGIETLNAKSDISLQALIRDLFDQYMPLLITAGNSCNNFKISDTLLKCFRDAKKDFSRLIFEILMSNFFTISSDNTMHKHFYLVTALLRNLLKGGKSYALHVTEFIIVICAPHVAGCYIKVHDHHPHRQQAVDFINILCTNPYYKENNFLREKLYNIVSSVVQKFLTINQHGTFEFLRSISLTEPEILTYLSPQIERTLTDLERNRRSNAGSLRHSWNQLRSSL